MPGQTIALTDLFASELAQGLNFFFGGRKTITWNTITPEEEQNISKLIDTNAAILAKKLPSVASEFLSQKSAFLKWAGVAKGMFPVSKPITYPSQPGTIGVAMLFPQAINYPGSTQSTGYTPDSWNISTTAKTNAFLYGSSTTFFRNSSTNASSPGTGHAISVVMQNGLIEYSTTPKLTQEWRILTEAASEYGIYVGEPLMDVQINQYINAYQYPTLGQIPIWFDLGTRWYYGPLATGVDSIRQIGLVYYEHELFPDITY
jgi:hypothetical protein